MVSKGKGGKRFDRPDIDELGDSELDNGLIKHCAVIVSISTTEAILFSLQIVFFILAVVENYPMVVVNTETSGVEYLIGLEEFPKDGHR